MFIVAWHLEFAFAKINLNDCSAYIKFSVHTCTPGGINFVYSIYTMSIGCTPFQLIISANICTMQYSICNIVPSSVSLN